MRLRLETARLVLRPVEDGDASATARLMDAHVARYLVSWTAGMTARQGRLRIRAARAGLRRGDFVNFAVLERSSERLLGWVGLWRQADAPERGSLGYWIGAADQGRGYMTEAVEAFIPVASSLLGIRVVEAQVHPDNPASVAILRTLGFEQAGSAMVRFPAFAEEQRVLVYRKAYPGERLSPPASCP